jgi:hypothetical protein
MARIRRVEKAATDMQRLQDYQFRHDPETEKMIHMVHAFLREKRRVCYGGTAIDALLPSEGKFYDKQYNVPDYDFLSPLPVQDAADLAKLFIAGGVPETHVRFALHLGTYNFLADFVPLADITYAPMSLYKVLQDAAEEVDGILYAPADYLRMNMYLELSRPMGDVSRWDKVYRRLLLLNHYRPIGKPPKAGLQALLKPADQAGDSGKGQEQKQALVNAIIDNGYVFLGFEAFATTWNPKGHKGQLLKTLQSANGPYMILSDQAAEAAKKLAAVLPATAKVVHHPAIGELLPAHYEIRDKQHTYLTIWQTVACHAYVPKPVPGGKEVRIASIDTMLSFYLAMQYVRKDYLPDIDRLHCAAQALVDMEANARRARGLKGYPAFPAACLGHQETRREMMRKRLQFTKTEGMAIRKRIEHMAQRRSRPSKQRQSIVTGTASRIVLAKGPKRRVTRTKKKQARKTKRK